MKRLPKSVVNLFAAAAGASVTVLVYQFAFAADSSLPAPKFNIENTTVAREQRVTSFAPVIKKAAPSVVNIYSTRVIRVQPYGNSSGWFWGGGPHGRPLMEQGLGSGVIVSSDGYILTANHVIEGADDVKVTLADGEKKLDVKVVGSDPATDIAVLKVDAKNLPAITLADSDKVEVGDVVLAIGNPFEVGQTVTMGIVSGLGRQGLGINQYENFIQTDAAINMGNSGGALADAEGRLIGINTAILSRSGGNQGIGFAVPINLARSVMESIVREGKVSRGYLGVNIQPLDADLAKENHLPNENGALVHDVMPETPADRAGLKKNDVIIALNGQQVMDSRRFRLTISELSPQSKVILKVMREGSEKTITATLAQLPEKIVASSSPSTENGSDNGLSGVSVANLTPRVRREFNLPARVQGVVVTAVADDSLAREVGLEPGDVVTEINHHPVISADEATKLLQKASSDRLLLRVLSRDEEGNMVTRFLIIQSNG